MTIIETRPATAELAELPDDDAPQIGKRRSAHLIEIGWHVRVDGRWLLVDRVTTGPGGIAVWFSDGALLTISRQARQWTRTPAEQIQYMASVLPARDHYQPPRTRPLGTLFGGSARDRSMGPL